MRRVALHDEPARARSGLVERDGVVGRRRRVALDADHEQRRAQSARGVDRPVGEDLVGRGERHLVRNLVVDVGLHRRRAALGGRDHDLLARMHAPALAGRDARAAVFLERGEELEPVGLGPHPVQPVLAVGDRHLADGGADARVGRREQDRVAAARAARPEDADRVGIDVVARRQVRDGVDEVLELHARRELLRAARVAEAAVVDDEHAEAGLDERLVVADVELRVLQAEPAGALDDRAERRPDAASGVRQSAEIRSPSL